MAETKTHAHKIEREYTVPLRREWQKVPRYKRTSKSVKAVKEFVARHMKVADRDLKKVKLDFYLNNELWFRGGKTPFSKIKVKVRKEGDIVKVELADVPEHVKFLKLRHERLHKKADKKEEPKVEEKKEEVQTPEEKKTEVEKEKSVEDANIKMAEQKTREQKHVAKDKKVVTHRMALKK